MESAAPEAVSLKSVGTKVDTYDLHATVLHPLGLDQPRQPRASSQSLAAPATTSTGRDAL